MDSYLVWGMGLVAASLVLLLLDVLLPSGGALSLAAGLSLIAGIVCLFLYDRQGDTYWGPSTLLGSLILGPLTPPECVAASCGPVGMPSTCMTLRLPA